MECLRVSLRPLSAFGGPIRGDTLFGQLCWAVRNRWGEERLEELLRGYTEGQPFAVCSDAFPAGHLPRPALPLHRFAEVADADRKAIKRRHWLPWDALDRPVAQWLAELRTETELLSALGSAGRALIEVHAQPHNSINRLTGTTGRGAFAPYTLDQHWFPAGLPLECYVLVDPQRLSVDDAGRLLADIGLAGYGRDAGIGLGKFAVEQLRPDTLPRQPDANACFTLAPCAPQGLGYDPEGSHYAVFTRFGRHGDRAVHTGRPFKSPVLLADTGAVLTPRRSPPRPLSDRGLAATVCYRTRSPRRCNRVMRPSSVSASRRRTRHD